MPVSVNGYPLSSADIHEPLFGVWFADIDVDSTEALTGAITIDIDGVEFVGAVWNGRSGIIGGRWVARIAGGAAGMGTVVEAKNYVGVNVRATVDDIMRNAGETLDASGSDSTTLARGLPRWHRMRGTAGNAMTAILDEAASSYRIQRDGTVKVGVESFTELDPGDDTLPEVDTAPGQNSRVYGPLTPIVLPGVAIDGASVEYVWTQVTGGSLRQTAWFADA